ncbi:hypothetical protein GCM10009721_35610 [Terrabacter tumescens]|uniref:Uncharacterized protein n=1 Tax=Terrabacter tumescens TaxID=60443 RepID=A0ABQ2IE13_9MICO|nr:hypothetical protein [Terrabacter tumescens]GGN05029.1 hypothetical protein GCM10009721_35610 [Terrabacter tumescens]
MFKGRRDRGAVSGAIIGVICVVLGGGAAAVAVTTVVSTSGPNDSRAVETGPRSPVEPSQVIQYGG